MSKKDEDKVDSEEENAQSSDDEKDNAKALAKIVDSDDEDAVVDADAAFQEGQDVGEIPKESKELLKSSKSGNGEHGIVYIGRLPRKCLSLCLKMIANSRGYRRFLRT